LRQRESGREYHLTHWEDNRDASTRHRAKLLGALCTEHDICQNITRRIVWGRDEGHCRVGIACNFDFIPFEEMTIDHTVPYIIGGKHCWYNVQTACSPCNKQKPHKSLSTGKLKP
jgi:hypothetical protein